MPEILNSPWLDDPLIRRGRSWRIAQSSRWVALLAALAATLTTFTHAAGPAEIEKPRRPNILWITSEDNGPNLGCYGDAYASTPNLDQLASRGMRFTTVWSVAPVCAPARTALISGLYPSSTGSEHMRSLVPMPPSLKMFPQYLREAGYYCSNNSKEDYNLAKPGQVWDDSSARAGWRNRQTNQPFFAVFNHTQSHEGQIRKRLHTAIHNPANVRIPPYHPDHPEVRRDWAQYHDLISVIDGRAGGNLRELEEDGLADDTIVFYFGDHGAGMPRHKRTACNSGLSVPLIVYFPPKYHHLAPADYEPGAASARPISFVDFAPTVLSLCGIASPSQWQGATFLGPNPQRARRYLHGLRGRMDERQDLVRCVRDERYVYVRNYMPHRPHGQHVDYMFQTPTTRVWHELHLAGQLTPEQNAFWEPKAPEELYDIRDDPGEVHNLATTARYHDVLQRFRHELRQHQLRIDDVGMLPESLMHELRGQDSPYTLGHNAKRYPLRRILDAAEFASSAAPLKPNDLHRAATDPHGAVRYWTAMAILIRSHSGVASHRDILLQFLEDKSPSVRVPAAEALARLGSESDHSRAVSVLLQCADQSQFGPHLAIEALNALDALGPQSDTTLKHLRSLPQPDETADERRFGYAGRMTRSILKRN